MPLKGIEEWDKAGEPAHDPDGLKAFTDEIRKSIQSPVQLTEVDAHINDQAFADKAIELFDLWVSEGIVQPAS